MADTQNTQNNESSIKFGLVLNTLFTVVAFVFGIITGSLALIATATDGLLDSFTLTIAFIANRLGRREANDSKSFGYGRATILAALLNASVMLTVSVLIGYEAIQRLSHPRAIEGGVVAAVAFVGILVNGSIAFVLSKHRKDLNMRSVFVDNAIDAVAALATLIAGLIILFTGVHWVDTVVGLAIAALLIYNSFKILMEAVQILLEGTPKDLNVADVKNSIQNTRRVLRVDDMHVWAIRSGYNALSCHIVIDDNELPHSREIIEAIKTKLRDDHNIQHATIEIELEDCTTHEEHEKH
jgi:cobalt-zinc-cadmium efflux system protein